MDTGAIYQQLIESASLIIIALLGWGAFEFKRFVKGHIDNSKLQTSLLLTGEVVRDSVKASISRLGVDAKAAVADGKVTKEELAMIETKAFKDFSEQVAPELQKRLNAHVGDLQTIIVNKIGAELQKAEKVTG